MTTAEGLLTAAFFHFAQHCQFQLSGSPTTISI